MELSSAGIFPILVVDAWDGRRWIETVNGEFGKPAWGVQIGHTTTDGGPVVLVSTIRKDEFFEYESSTEPDPLVVVAYVGLFNLLNATFPGFSGEMRERYSRALPKFANREAKRAPEWPTVPWTVDGVPIRPHLFFFCGAWVAVADELPLITLGDGQSADEIHLVHDTDSRLQNRPSRSRS